MPFFVAAMLKYWELDPVLEYFSIHKCVEWWLNDRCKRPPSASRRRWKYIWFHNSHCRQSTWDWWYYRLQFHHLYMFRMTIHDEVVASVCFWRATTHSKWIKRPCSTVSDAKELSFRRGNPGRSLWMPFRPRSTQSMSSATILTPRNAATKRRSDCRHNDEFIHAEILIWVAAWWNVVHTPSMCSLFMSIWQSAYGTVVLRRRARTVSKCGSARLEKEEQTTIEWSHSVNIREICFRCGLC